MYVKQYNEILDAFNRGHSEGYAKGYADCMVKFKCTGRPLGSPNRKYKLDEYEEEIIDYLSREKTHRWIANHYSVHVYTITAFIKRNNLEKVRCRIGEKQC